MHSICDQMPEIIFRNYFDSGKYLFSLYFEAFNSIKGFCVLLGNGGLISQACVILRMALERTATIRVLETHKELLESYIDHRRFRFEIRNGKDKAALIKAYFKNECDFKKVKPQEFLEYGWFKTLSEVYSFDSLIKLSKIQEKDDSIKNWKNELNQWTHGAMEFTNLCSKEDNAVLYGHSLILLAAKLLDNLMVDFHNNHGFDFEFNDIGCRESFEAAYAIAAQRAPDRRS